MSRARHVLVASLIVNGLLAFVLLRQPAATAEFFASMLEPANSAAVRKRSAVPAAAPLKPAFAPAEVLAAALVAPGGFSALVTRLREAGFPPHLVQVVVTAVVRDHYAGRRAALDGSATVEPYWQRPAVEHARPELTAARHALVSEERILLHELLGRDRYALDDMLDPSRRVRAFGSLPAEKIARLRRLEADFDDLVSQTHEENSTRDRPGGRERRAVLQQERQAAIERMLTPAELFEFELRNGNAARGLLNRFTKSPLTESEFRLLYPARKAYDAAATPLPPPATTEMIVARRAEADRQFEEDVQRLLGEARYREVQR